MIRHTPHLRLLSLLCLAGCLLWACTSGDQFSLDLRDNDGSQLTTAPGQPLNEVWFIGKWDLDGERTNTANGNSGVAAIPSDILHDIFGEGWKFEHYGFLKVDTTGGYTPATWKLNGNQLTINFPDRPAETFVAHFSDGYLYLQDRYGRYRVLEKNKFFGF